MPTGTFEADLRAAREAGDLSLGDIQQKTRIPIDVLRRFEEGDLVGDPTYNEVYLKAFLQSYAKALGLAPSTVLAAYAQQRAGQYDGSLRPGAAAPASADPVPPAGPDPTPVPPVASASATTVADDEPEPPTPAPRPANALPPAVQALTSGPDPTKRPATDAPPKTLAQARVNRPAVPGARRSFDKNWGTILGLTALLVAVLAGALYVLVFADEDDAEEPTTVAVGPDEIETPIDSSGVGAGAASVGPRLQLPIRVTVTAAGGKLQNFRVTETPNDRLGHWMEDGDSKTFESDSLLVFDGEGADGIGANAMFEMQGQRWKPAQGSVLRIDRQRGQALLDSLAGAGTASAPAP